MSLSGKSVVFTGKLAMPRKDATAFATAAGATCASAISGKTNILVAGPGAGAKEAQAKAKGIDVWTEDEFVAALGAAGVDIGGGSPAAGASAAGKKQKASAPPAAEPAGKKGKAAAAEPAPRPHQIVINKQSTDLSPDGELLILETPPKNAAEMKKMLREIEGLAGDDWVKTLTFPRGLTAGTGAVLCDYLVSGCPSITGLKIHSEFGENCSDAENRLCVEAVGRLLKAERLQLLDLSGIWLGELDAIAQGVAASSRLEALYLNRCSLTGSSGAAKILEAVQRKPGGLQRLDLEGCGFWSQSRRGDTPAGPLLTALVDSGKLAHLNIKGVYADPPTTIALFGSVAGGGSKLQSLSIKEADRGLFTTQPPMVPGERRPPQPVPSEEAVTAVVDAVGRTQSLLELDLSNCPSLASDAMAARIAQSLRNAPAGATLQKLSLEGMCPVVVGRPEKPIVAQPGIGKEGLEELLGAVDSAPALRQLVVTVRSSRSGVPKETLEQLRAHPKIVVEDC